MRTSRCSECNKTAPQDNGRENMAMKTFAKDEAASHDDEIAAGDVAPFVNTATFMKQPLTETD